jgi:hypothetical protein
VVDVGSILAMPGGLADRCGCPGWASGGARPSRAQAGIHRRRPRRSRQVVVEADVLAVIQFEQLDGLVDRAGVEVSVWGGAEVVEPELHAVEVTGKPPRRLEYGWYVSEDGITPWGEVPKGLRIRQAQPGRVADDRPFAGLLDCRRPQSGFG